MGMAFRFMLTCCIIAYFKYSTIITFYFILDKKILGLSFGSMMGGSVRDCHPLNDDPRNPYCKGVEGLLESYKTTLNNGKIFKLL